MGRTIRTGPILGKVLTDIARDQLVITPRFNEFLLKGRADEPLRPEVAAIIHKQLTSTPRNRTRSFSSSSAGSCERAQVLGYLGEESWDNISPQLHNIFADGRWRHLRWQAHLLQGNIIDTVECRLPWPEMRSMGSMDGRGTVPSDHRQYAGATFGWELKGVSPFMFGKYRDATWREEHKRQVHRYFLSGGDDIFVVTYENKGTQEWFEWVVEEDPKLLQESREELERLNEAIDKKRLPDMLKGCKAQGGPTWKECGYGGNGQAPCPKAGNWPRLKKA